MDQVNSIFIYLENTNGSGKFHIYVSRVLDMGQKIPYLCILRTHMGQVNSIFIWSIIMDQVNSILCIWRTDMGQVNSIFIWRTHMDQVSSIFI